MPQTIAPDVDRLPWLTDDHVRRSRRPSDFVTSFLAASAVAIIAALSYWLGMSGLPGHKRQAPYSSEVRIEVPPMKSPPVGSMLPEPAMPQVEPSPVPPPVALQPRREVRLHASPATPATRKAAPAGRSRPAKTTASLRAASAEKNGLSYSNPWLSAGASGRMVRVGAYSSMDDGKKAWSRLAQLSPAISRLPAVVTDLSSKSGRVYYWLQIGTTSQAHSEVLCQRMRAIRQSCVVVDLSGARKGSGDERQPIGV
jgi:hypothetical protein